MCVYIQTCKYCLFFVAILNSFYLSFQSVYLAIIQILIENLLGPKYCFILDDVDTTMNKAKFSPSSGSYSIRWNW